MIYDFGLMVRSAAGWRESGALDPPVLSRGQRPPAALHKRPAIATIPCDGRRMELSRCLVGGGGWVGARVMVC